MNILMITAQFPNYDNIGVTYATPFLFNYAKEWTQLGHSVTIIHLMRVYPKIFNPVAKGLAKLGNHALEKYIISPEAQNETLYTHMGIKVHRFTYKKYIPHGATPDNEIRKLSSKISKVISGNEYDVVIGDFFDPVMCVIDRIKDSFNCPIGQVIHVSDFPMFDNKKVRKCLPNVGYWLLRSASQENKLKQYVTDYRHTVICSGIEEENVKNEPQFRTCAEKLLFVGMLNKFKGIDTILDALIMLKDKNFTLKILGEGTDRDYFVERVNTLGLQETVEFIGKVPHDKVFEYMNESDVQIMISHETFGMVYVEAMSQGCIPIGAVGEGIDGVVVNGKNGFLSPLGDAEALADVLSNLSSMDPEKVSEISRNAYETAKSMTHKKLAKTILEGIKNIREV